MTLQSMTYPHIKPKPVSNLSSEQIRERVFKGELLSFSPPSMRKYVSHVKKIIYHSFDCEKPTYAHILYDREEFLQRAEVAQNVVNGDESKSLFAQVLNDSGMPSDNLFWDTLGLRVAPPVRNPEELKHRGFRSHVGVHRDTWGAGFQAQINWWAPVWPVAMKRTMGFYPSYWQRPLENSTAQWSFKEFLKSRKNAKPGHAASYPSAPAALKEPDEFALPFLMPVGSLACFSSAHLHGSITNSTSLTRFSLEIRTLHLNDLKNDNGAPNVDNQSQHLLTGLYAAVSDGRPLKESWTPNAAA